MQGRGTPASDEENEMKTRMFAMTTLGIALVTGMAMSSAVAGDKPGSHDMDKMMKMMDSNGDGMVSAAEHAAHAKAMFDKMDSNHDGMVDKAEMDAGMKEMRAKRDAKPGMDHDHDAMKHDAMKHDDMKHDDMPAAPAAKDTTPPDGT